MCFRNTWVGESFADMDRETFDRAMATMPAGVETIFFGGMGEPLHHKDILYMVAEASKRAGRVELLTNGTLLTPEMSKSLIEAGLGMLWVSIENFEADAYGQIRMGSSLKKITENISAFNRERYRFELAQRDGSYGRSNEEVLKQMEEHRSVSLGMTFVAMKSNVHMLGGLSKFARTYNINEVNISNVIPTDAASEAEGLYTRVVNFSLGDRKSNEGYPTVDLPYMDFNLPAVQDGLMGLLSTDNNLMIGGAPLERHKRYCRFVEEGCCFVKHDGQVTPCMALLHSQRTWLDGSSRTVYSHSFGSVKETGLADIWNGESYEDFRARVKAFSFSPCISCGGCDNRDTNEQDCIGNIAPTCGACLWSEGIIACP
jgi:MoaA/NifB/PqqE/SkfB family radical SAM enzyme